MHSIGMQRAIVYAAAADMCWHVLAQGLSQDELLVDAQQELLRVAEDFDPSKGARLVTYAWAYIFMRLSRVSATVILPIFAGLFGKLLCGDC